ncbi:MAG: YkgJ family cysteine cluster protein [Chitinophagaceae bacterium]|nr:YkgJ family cysteine cluster protein [Chitinophagaceae bacterium]
MEPTNLRLFNKKVKLNKKYLRTFLTKLEKNPPKKLDKSAVEIEKQVWQETECLSCANCCKKMTPTFSPADIKRIATHFKMTPVEFKDKWLVFDKKAKDWQNKKQPCQFLDMQTNMCSIYEIRPADCSGFPHLIKRNMINYIHVHKQNIEYCPATYKMVEKMQLFLRPSL